MTSDRAELLSALMDREDVDPEALADALEDAEARRALVAFAAVRRALREPVPGEREWMADRSRPAPLAWVRRGTPWRAAAAAVLVAAGLAAGVIAERYRSHQRPPEPSRVVQLEPLDADRR